MDGHTDGRTDGWTEFLPILQDFVPCRGRCPKTVYFLPNLQLRRLDRAKSKTDRCKFGVTSVNAKMIAWRCDLKMLEHQLKIRLELTMVAP